MDRNKVILVNEHDEPLGEMDKLEAHQQGRLHRAFSVFIFNKRDQVLLQQRATHKYHGGDLWTNACCSHPQWNEDLQQSATERLAYEMGLDCLLEKAFSFIYQAPVENGLMEHEFDHVFWALTDQNPVPNEAEVKAYQWVDSGQLLSAIQKHPEIYTSWFKIALPLMLAYKEKLAYKEDK